MSKVAAVATLMLAGCGRIGFDAVIDAMTRDGTGIGDGPPATICGGLANTCGPTGNARCCDSPVVPGGTYARAYDVSGDGMHPDMSFGATVSTFRLDKYEVTVGRFRLFVTAGQGTQSSPPISGVGAHPNIANSGWDVSWKGSLVANAAALIADIKCGSAQTWTDTPGGNESLAMNCITWYEAMAFCA